jgi:HSP20 family protein
MEDLAMTLVRRFNPQLPDLGNVFDDFFGSDFTAPAFSGRRSSVPAVNVKENQDEFLIEVAAPGLTKEDFKIEVNNNVLTISAEVKKEEKSEDDGYTRREFQYSSFCRSFAIPKNEVDEGKVKAAYKDGLLTITLQKREEVKPKPSRMIEIK